MMKLLLILLIVPFVSALSGAIVFFMVALSVLLPAWLFGADDPRDISIAIGIGAGVAWALCEFFVKVAKVVGVIRAERQRRAVEKALEES